MAGRGCLVALSVMGLAAACGSDGDSLGEPSEAPSATAFVDFAGPALGSLVPKEVIEPCPSLVPPSSDTALVDEATRLEPMLGLVVSYGAGHLDSFDHYGLVWDDGGDASVFASFAGPLEEHRVALADIVPFPEELVVCQSPMSGRQRTGVVTALDEELGAGVQVVRHGEGGRVGVRLASGDEAVAARLHERYGGAVALTVGALPYPISEGLDVCPPIPTSGAGTALTLAPADAEPVRLTSDTDTQVALLVTNTGDDPVRVVGDPLELLVVDAASRVVGGGSVTVETWGPDVTLAGGAAESISGYVSTASCRAELGYELVPGDYLVVAVLRLIDGDVVVSSPLPARIER